MGRRRNNGGAAADDGPKVGHNSNLNSDEKIKLGDYVSEIERVDAEVRELTSERGTIYKAAKEVRHQGAQAHHQNAAHGNHQSARISRRRVMLTPMRWAISLPHRSDRPEGRTSRPPDPW